MLFYHLYLLPLPAFTLLLMSIRLQRYPIVVSFFVDDIDVDSGAAIAARAANIGGSAVAVLLLPASTPIGTPALKAS